MIWICCGCEMMVRKMDLGLPQCPCECGEMRWTEAGDLTGTARTVVRNNQGTVEDYLRGEDGAINFLVGQMMKESHGTLDPSNAREALEILIGVYMTDDL